MISWIAYCFQHVEVAPVTQIDDVSTMTRLKNLKIRGPKIVKEEVIKTVKGMLLKKLIGNILKEKKPFVFY